MRQGNDVTCWAGHLMPPSINPCVLTGGSNNTLGCAESQRPAALTSPYWVTKRDGSIGWLKMRLRPQVRTWILNKNFLSPRRCFYIHINFHIHKIMTADFSKCKQRENKAFVLRAYNFNKSFSYRYCLTATKTVHGCIWLNCEGGRSIITLLPPPSQSVVMTKGCAGSKRRTKALSSWLPTETGSNTA